MTTSGTLERVAEVVALLVDPKLFVLWMADDATLDPVRGGTVRWTI